MSADDDCEEVADVGEGLPCKEYPAASSLWSCDEVILQQCDCVEAHEGGEANLKYRRVNK